MLTPSLLAAALAAPPDVALAWRGPAAKLQLSPPDGTKLADDAPVDVALRWGEGRSLTASLDGGEAAALVLPDLRGQPVEGELAIVLCSLADGACWPTRWAVAGQVPSDRRGRVELTVGDVGQGDRSAAATDVDPLAAAFARAEADGKAVLIDFGAVWCPPCNLLGAEVLHASPAPEALAAYELVELDVDHPSSFAAKQRYAVRGYPTVVVADPDGTERARRVGYEGREAFLAWLASASTSTEAAELAAGADAATPERALELAWVLLQDRRFDDAAPFIARGAGVDSALARRVRVLAAPTPADVRWLLANDAAHIERWFFAALELAEADRPLAQQVAAEALRRLSGPALADALYVDATLRDDPAGFALAANVLRTALRGDPAHDRGHYAWLADLTAKVDLDRAVRELGEHAARWPDDPTWPLQAATLLADADRHADALPHAREAAQRAWGDNALRAARAEATALLGLGRAEEATAVIDAALAQPAPTEPGVRTHRYREQLEALRPG